MCIRDSRRTDGARWAIPGDARFRYAGYEPDAVRREWRWIRKDGLRKRVYPLR